MKIFYFPQIAVLRTIPLDTALDLQRFCSEQVLEEMKGELEVTEVHLENSS